MLTIRLLLAYLVLASGIFSYLLAGPVGAGVYVAFLFLLLTIEPVYHRVVYLAELAAFNREAEYARQLALASLKSYGGTW